MKHVIKRKEPLELKQLKAKMSRDYKPTYADLGTERKRAVHLALMEEQGCICCYCETRINEDGSHIEHLRPQKRYPDSDLDYHNLLASCQRELQARTEEPLHCGMLKGDWYDDSLMVSPLAADCEKRFRFTADGGILPLEDDRAAETTIRKLGLNIDKLRAMRRGAIDGALGDDIDKLSDQDIRRLIRVYRQPDSRGRFQQACTAVIYVLSGFV